eukprot:758153-Hanusia_phi.AAC.7
MTGVYYHDQRLVQASVKPGRALSLPCRDPGWHLGSESAGRSPGSDGPLSHSALSGAANHSRFRSSESRQVSLKPRRSLPSSACSPTVTLEVSSLAAA